MSGNASTLRLVMVAGEASGDALGAGLLAGLQARQRVQAAGIGGPRMAALGFDAWWPAERLSVFGYADALRRLPELLRLRASLRERALAARPAAFIGIDAPDFNFALEARLRSAGIPTVHVVCPSIWAWRGERIHTLAKAADLVLCLFPFEPELLAQAGIAAEYVGHPLADAIPLEPPRAAARAALGLGQDEGVVALLPGSRASEVALIGPSFLAAAEQLAQQRPHTRFVLPVAPGRETQVTALLAKYPGLSVQALPGQAHQALAACDAAMVASGTATLEAALYKVPMTIAYRLGALNWWLMKGKGYLPWVGLPNILCREFVVPERIQDAATPEQLAQDTARWLDDPAAAAACRSRFDALHLSLRQGAAHKASSAIERLIAQRGGEPLSLASAPAQAEAG